MSFILKPQKKDNKKGASDFLVIGYPYLEMICSFIDVTSFYGFSNGLQF